LGRNIYKKFNFIQFLFYPLTSTGVEVGPLGQTIDRPIEKVVNLTSTPVQVQSNTKVVLPSHIEGTLTITPTTPLQPTTPYIPQNVVGTPVHHEMSNPTTHTLNYMTNIDWGETIV
jgi:hypothetical protein